jgi:hypothetical protein
VHEMQHQVQSVRLERLWALRNVRIQNEAIPTVPPEGQTEEWKALKPCVKAANVKKWHNSVRTACRNLGGKWEMGQESEL